VSLSFLKLVRFLVPAALILIFTKLLGFITGWWTTILPDFSKGAYLPIVVAPAVLYYITPLRRWINAPHHTNVTERLRAGLVTISGYPDSKNKYTWKKLRPLFFSLIDQDESLKQKSKLAYANGAVWTSFADSTALSILFCIAALSLYGVGLEEAFPPAMMFLVIAAVSFAGSRVCTRKQIEIGAEQLEIIEFKNKNDVERRLNALD
jgi:hypothetical protein